MYAEVDKRLPVEARYPLIGPQPQSPFSIAIDGPDDVARQPIFGREGGEGVPIVASEALGGPKPQRPIRLPQDVVDHRARQPVCRRERHKLLTVEEKGLLRVPGPQLFIKVVGKRNPILVLRHAWIDGDDGLPIIARNPLRRLEPHHAVCIVVNGNDVVFRQAVQKRDMLPLALLEGSKAYVDAGQGRPASEADDRAFSTVDVALEGITSNLIRPRRQACELVVPEFVTQRGRGNGRLAAPRLRRNHRLHDDGHMGRNVIEHQEGTGEPGGMGVLGGCRRDGEAEAENDA